MAAKKKEEKAQGVQAEAGRLCKEHGVDKLHRNSRGEWFTQLTYAIASEGGDKKKVETYYAKPEEVTKEDAGASDKDAFEGGDGGEGDPKQEES